jgi:hypothetical protein
VAADRELLKLHDELKATIALMEEASAVGAEKISERKKDALLQSFKVVKPAEISRHSKWRRAWGEWAAVAAMIALLATLGTGALRGFKEDDEVAVAMRNLRGGDAKAVEAFGETTVERDSDFAKERLQDAPATPAKPQANARPGTARFDDVSKSDNNDLFAAKIELPAGTAPTEPANRSADWQMQVGQRPGAAPVGTVSAEGLRVGVRNET